MKKFLLLIGILALALGLFADVTIGSGTSTQRQPFDALYGFGRSADIYLASEINATGNITHLGWYVGLATSTSIPIKIYLTTTTATSLAQTPWATLTAGLTPVYNATAQFNALGWAQLDITDFAYNHQTSGNLLVLCEANYTGSGAASTDCPEFRYTNDGNTGSMHQYWQQDGEAPTFDGRVTADRPNIKFDMVKEYDTCANPYLATLPLVDYNGTTAGLTNDYTADMFSGMTIDPRYCTGKDWVAKLSISEDGLLNVSLDDQPGSPWQYISMVLVSTIPSTESPAVVLAQHCTGYGPLSITNFPVTAGYYYLIVDNFPGPEDIHFVLNITHSIYPPEPASLVSPADGATNITLDTTLNWASGGGTVDGYTLSLWKNLATHLEPIVEDLDLGMLTTYAPTLESGMEYSWKVVPYSNAGGEAVDCPTWTFSTMDAPISSFPYFEGFEVNADTLPLNWIATEAAPNASQHWKAAASAEHGPSAPASGSSFAWLYCYHASANYNPYSLVSPPLALDATAKRLSYQYWIGDDTVAEPLFVDISTDLASWTTLYTHSNASNTLAWHYNVISLAAYSSQTVYLRFRGVSNYGNGMTDLGIDNIWIEDIPSYPILTCSPTDINFGDVMQGVQTGPRYVTITNTGGGILNLVAADISFAAVPSNPVTDFSFGAGNLPAALSTGESVLIPVYVNASSEGPLYGSLQIVNNQGPQPAYAYVDLSANGLSEDMVAIGDGHFNLEIPINPYYGYSYSQSIFLQSEINVPDQRIEKVFYYWNGAAEANVSNDWTMYMGHTALTEFADEDSWIPRANLSQVFQGNVALPATAGWIEITLNAPFPYDNSANLVIAVDENAEDYDGSSMYFLSTNTTTNRSIRFYDDDENPDPAAPPTGDLVAGYPNLKLGFVAPLAEAPGTVTLTWPQEEATNLPRTGFDLSWTPSLYGGTPTHYTLYLNQTQYSDCIYDGLVFENLTGTSFNTVTDGNLSFNYGEYWCWMVVAHNSYGSSEDNITNRFQIGEDPTITIPHTQNFDAATFPYGWTQANIGISSDRWFISESAEAGGEANELVCAWIEAVGISRLISPPINTEGISSFEVSFQQFFYDYAEGCTASLQYSHDLQSWYEAGWSLDSGGGDVADTVSVVVTPWINQPITYLAWTIIGNHYQFNNWYIDNVSIKLPPVPPIALPFIEDWTHGSFETNMWTADSENWISNQHTGVLGYMLCAAFKPEPRLYNYESILSSHDFDARGIMSVKFSFDLLMTSDNSSVNNTLTWEVWDGWDWYTIDSHNSQDGNVYWERQIADLSNFVSNRIFKIRFVASGSDSNAIRSLHIDNIHLVEWTDTLAPVTDLKLSKHAVNDYSTLHWTAVPGADWYRIYVSEDPYGEFVHLGFAPQAVFVFDNADVPADKAFFRVTAGTGTQPAAAKLSRPPNK